MSKVRLIDICQPKQWKTIPTSQLTKEGYPVYGANGKIGFYSEYNHEKETILITCRGATCGSLNISEPFSYVNGNAMCLDDLDDSVSLKYLYYNLCGYNFAKVISGTAQPQITGEGLSKVYLNIHYTNDQERIVRIFDELERVIISHKQYIQKLDELIKSWFVEMFGDIYTNKQNYPIHMLANYIDFLTSGSRGWAKYCTDEGSEWFITIKNVKDCRITTDNIQPVNAPDNMEAKRTKVNEGDLLISITADLGRTGVVTKEIAEHGAYINQHLTCVRLDKTKLIPLYVAYFLESKSGTPQFASKNQTGVKAGLNFNSIKSLRLLVPPLAQQQQFAAFVAQIDKSKLAVQKSIEKLEILKKSLMQEYFG